MKAWMPSLRSPALLTSALPGAMGSTSLASLDFPTTLLHPLATVLQRATITFLQDNKYLENKCISRPGHRRNPARCPQIMKASRFKQPDSFWHQSWTCLFLSQIEQEIQTLLKPSLCTAFPWPVSLMMWRSALSLSPFTPAIPKHHSFHLFKVTLNLCGRFHFSLCPWPSTHKLMVLLHPARL